MAVQIWDSANECFKDAETPVIHNAENEAWKESTGFVYNKENEAWEEKWSSKPKAETIYENNTFGILGEPALYSLFSGGKGSLVFNSDSIVVKDDNSSSYYHNSILIFPNLIDFSQYKYAYIEGKDSISLRSTNYKGNQGSATLNGANPHWTNSINVNTGVEIEKTSRGRILQYEITEGEGYLSVPCSGGYTISSTFTIYRIWFEKKVQF